jgi:Kef-type K+ transport system membrane component KefB
MNSIFLDIGVVVIVATAFALLARAFKQPPLIGYILTGIVLGPLGTQMIGNQDVFNGMKEIGLALLLFMVGLEMDWSKAKQQLSSTLVLGIAQIVASFTVGMLLASLTKQSLIFGVYISLSLAFASTVIVVKVLSESRDLNSLHGRLSVSILLFQDLAAIVSFAILGGMSQASSLSVGSLISLLILKLLAIVVIIWFITGHFLPGLFARIAHSNELLFLSSLAWCFVLSLTLEMLGFPLEIGALIAGVSLASLPYSLDIAYRMGSLRDFFVIILFVALGSSVAIPSASYLALTITLILITIIGKPIVSFLVLCWRGYTSRTAFFTSLTQGQLSEFSLILTSLGLTLGQINQQLSSAIAVTTIISIFVSTILLTNRIVLYDILRPFLHLFERDHHHLRQFDQEDQEKLTDHIIIFGYHRMGYHILKILQKLNHKILIVDFNPDIIRKLKAHNIECIYGDVQDEELLEMINLDKAKMVISTIPHLEETTFLVKQIMKKNPHLKLIVTAHHIDDALLYYKLGASYVILPHVLGGEYVANLINEYEEHKLGELMRHRAEEIKLLRTKNQALYYD